VLSFSDETIERYLSPLFSVCLHVRKSQSSMAAAVEAAGTAASSARGSVGLTSLMAAAAQDLEHDVTSILGKKVSSIF